jgi:Family of unknown function (DUF6544)
MLRVLLLILLAIHGSIHLMGFFKSINPESITQLKQSVSSLQGILWLITAILFLGTAALFLFHKDYWWVIALAAVLLSQFLIILFWSDAKFGTIANILILIVSLVGFSQWRFAGSYREDVQALLQKNTGKDVLTEEDISQLPDPVKKYIRHTGYIGKKKISSFKAEFEGQIRSSEGSDWMKFRANQYSQVVEPARYFFIRASMKGIPVHGYHRFKNGNAIMDIRAASIVKVQYAEGPEMNISETVTHFNDMCLLAPGSLINSNISWEDVSDNEVRAKFTNKGITITAILQFNNKGELTNFISDNRYYSSSSGKMQKARWMTPVMDYKEKDGIRFPSYGEAIWAMPEGNFTYAKMKFNSIEANPAN